VAHYRDGRLKVCADRRCTDGLTECRGCNGWGVVTMGGRKYKRRSGARTIEQSVTKRDHDACNGSGLAPCGCVELDSVARVLVGA
jgi:hypothetical protein